MKPPINFTDGEQIRFHLHGAGAAKYSMDKIGPLIKKLDIDIFGVLLDTFMCFEAGFLTVDTSPAKTFFYYPSDGGGTLPLNCQQVLQKVNMPIAMAKFGKDQVKKLYNIDSEYIPHAIDPTLFNKIKDKEEVKRKWGLQGKFVVGTVARNQGRKMLDRTLKAFKIFSADKPDAILFLHCDPNDAASVFNIQELVCRYKLNNRVKFTGTSFHNSFNYTQMNEVYNVMDIFLLTTSGEGFGIPIIEAMACGVPQIVTDYTTTKELVEDGIPTGIATKLVGESDSCPYPHTDEILDGTITGSWNVERGMMSIYDCAKDLTKLYNDRILLKKYSDNSIKKSKYYTWDIILNSWRTAIKKLEKM